MMRQPRPLELGRGDAAANPLLRLLASTVGKPDDRERRHAPLEVGLDLDATRIEADESVSDRSGEHVATLGDTIVRVCDDCVTIQARRATRTSSKYSPARRPVRRFTWRW